MKVFLDSSFLIAFVLKDDSNFNKAFKLYEDNIFNNECYISNLIINEIITVIGNKGSLQDAINNYYVFKDNFNILNEYEISNFNDNVINTYKKHNTKLSFRNCIIIEIMRANEINNLVSFDKQFKKVKNINLIE
ncbi:type II toxin-antitoxin system VapC family toxin [Methanobrevibacter sp. DSM 116169]|uniref:type II toxin-antitoxin system VapC family toxin n=1 Tax=Methanobrevibacter sp. DSM 116169 TaxID=3242727 RepID=UPI0038FD10FF